MKRCRESFKVDVNRKNIVSSLQALDIKCTRAVYALRWVSLRFLDFFHSIFEKSSDEGLAPIFIIGCGHSGTTLMAALLNAHPSTSVIKGETYMFRFRNRPSEIDEKLRCECKEGTRIVEKTPRHTRYIERIFRLYPEARVIAMLRDGRDVACSIRKRNGSLYRGAIRWLFDNAFVDRKKRDSRLMVVQLETLLDQPEWVMKEVCKFLDLPWQQDLLQRHRDRGFDYMGLKSREAGNSVSEHAKRRVMQVNRPLEPATPRWPTELGFEEASLLDRLIGHELIRKGYTDNDSWVDKLAAKDS